MRVEPGDELLFNTDSSESESSDDEEISSEYGSTSDADENSDSSSEHDEVTSDEEFEPARVNSDPQTLQSPQQRINEIDHEMTVKMLELEQLLIEGGLTELDRCIRAKGGRDNQTSKQPQKRKKCNKASRTEN